MKDLKNACQIGHGYIYILSLGNGMVKVGKTGNPGQRIKSHRYSLGQSIGIKNEWVSVCHSNFHENERQLIDLLGAYNKQEIGKFCFDEMVKFAKNLEFAVDSKEKQLLRVSELKEKEKMLADRVKSLAISGDYDCIVNKSHLETLLKEYVFESEYSSILLEIIDSLEHIVNRVELTDSEFKSLGSLKAKSSNLVSEHLFKANPNANQAA